MKLIFFGAARSVTGSCYMLKAGGMNLLVDCGMRQGKDAATRLGRERLDFDAAEVDAVLLTHAHIDHSGMIPVLYKRGYDGKIICTKATADLCSIMLPDSGHIQEMENEWENRKRKRAGLEPVEPIYTAEEAQGVIKYFEGLDYGEIKSLSPGVRVRFSDAGHLLGSSVLEIWATKNGRETKFVFSGDLGNYDRPIINDPSRVGQADFVVMESTYGDRLHDKSTDSEAQLAQIIRETFARGGNVVIPAFSVGRTQEILYDLSRIVRNRALPELGEIPVYVDSPLSIEATEVFKRNCNERYLDEDAMNRIKSGDNPFVFSSLHFIKTAEESRALNDLQGSKVIISSSGMCEAGRIKHHLKHNLWREESSVVFAGYQAEGTLGRRILDGAERVTIFGENINVKAKVYKLEGASGHADKQGLIDWITAFSAKPKKVLVTHGEKDVALGFARTLGELGFEAEAPAPGCVFDTETLACEAFISAAYEEIDYIEEAYRLISDSAARLLDAAKQGEAMLKRASADKRARRLKSVIDGVRKMVANITRQKP